MNYNQDGFLYKISKKVLNLRGIIILVFIALIIFSLVFMNKTNVTNDLSVFLPDYTETKKGYKIMQEEFVSYATANFIISNIEYETANEIAENIKQMPYVLNVSFDNTTSHYNASCANISVTFSGVENDENVINTYQKIHSELSKYDLLTYTGIQNSAVAAIQALMIPILITLVVVLIAVLLLTTSSFVEMIICIVVFGIAVLLNMGTNFVMPYVSNITFSIATTLQLAISVDYTIILCKKVEDETKKTDNYKEGIIVALSKTMVEIFSSSLTTIVSLVCLIMMQFRLGFDMGVVLAKGVFCTLITVFFLMPGLLYIFRKPIIKTKHKTFVPKIKKISKLVVNTKVVFAILFAVLIPFGVVLSNNVKYAFTQDDINELVPQEDRIAMHKLHDLFGYETQIALLVPGGNYTAEKEITNQIKEIGGVTNVLGISTIEFKDGVVLSDSITSKDFAELFDLDYELAALLFMAHGAQNNNYSSIFKNQTDYSVPLYQILQFAFKMVDEGVVNLTPKMTEMIDTYRPLFENAIGQLIGKEHDRIVVSIKTEIDSPEAVQKVEKIRSIAKEYYKEGVYTFGEITTTKDARDTYLVDKELIILITLVCIFIIVLLSFKSIVGSIILVLVIQTAIWINFSLEFLYGNSPLFVTNMIVTVVQMGATIDYAIVLYNRYQTAKNAGMEKKQAMMRAMGDSFATIFASAIIFVTCGFLVGFGVKDIYINHIGFLVGQGALISFILIFTALPQLILIFDKWIDKTTIKFKHKIRKPLELILGENDDDTVNTNDEGKEETV